MSPTQTDIRKGAAMALCQIISVSPDPKLARRYAKAIFDHRWLNIPKQHRSALLRNIQEVRMLAGYLV